MRDTWFIGTGQFAALCLDGLTRNGLTFAKIITGNPTRSGRNNRENPSPVELKASTLGLDVTRTGKLTENAELISALTPDTLLFVIDFGQIIRDPFLSCMCLNIHPSLLPEYRGAAPIQRALLDGRSYTGVSVFRLAAAMDAGDILAQQRVEISPDDNASDMYAKLSAIGCKIAAEALSSPMTFTKQDDSLATYAAKLGKNEFAVSFTMSAKTFCDTVRALDMSGGAFVNVRGKRLKLWRVRLRDDVRAESPGAVIECGKSPVISCGDFGVELLDVQSEGKKKMSGREWAAGLRLSVHDIL